MTADTIDRPQYPVWRHRLASIAPWANLTAAGIMWIPVIGRFAADIAGALAVASVVTWMWHQYKELCERCIGSLPLDAQAQAERHKWALWFCHGGSGVVWVLALGGAYLGNQLDGLAETAVFSAQSQVLALAGFAQMRHNALQPWCPWCRDGGGGDDSEPVPDPADDNSKTPSNA